MFRKIPATVITGFLGAGKTTLIRNLMENAGGRRIALIVNEFGDVGVDGEILRGCGNEACGEEDIVELANGCICCTVAEDFIPTMQALIERDAPPDHIIIETSGLALPQPLVRAFGWPEIRTRVTVDGVVTLVDARAVADGRFAHDPAAIEAQRQADDMLDHETPLSKLFEDQLACADMVVVNKIDLISEEERTALEADLARRLRPGVRIVRTAHGRLPADVLLGMGAAAETDMAGRSAPHHEHGDGDHHHDHDHDDFASFLVETGEIADRPAFLEALREVIAAHDVLRLKGFVPVAGKPLRLAVQAVGPRVESWFERPFAPDEPRRGRLVVIGQAPLDEAAIARALTEAAGRRAA